MLYPEFIDNHSDEPQRLQALVFLWVGLKNIRKRIDTQRDRLAENQEKQAQAWTHLQLFLINPPCSGECNEERSWQSAGGKWDDFLRKKQERLETEYLYAQWQLNDSFYVLEQLQAEEVEWMRQIAHLLFAQSN